VPPLFSYEIVRLLRKFAKGPRDKIDLPTLAQAADEIEGLRALLRECKPFLVDASGVPDRARRLTRARQCRNRRMRTRRCSAQSRAPWDALSPLK
jgi:hypothetical protein